MATGTTPLTPLRFSRKQAATLPGIFARHLDYRVRTGELKALRDGTRIFITHVGLPAYFNQDHPTEGE